MDILLFFVLGGLFWFYFVKPPKISVKEIEEDAHFWKDFEKGIKN